MEWLTLAEFTNSESALARLAVGAHFTVLVDRELSAAALERIEAAEAYGPQLRYVVMGRKDWRFLDTYRSLPHFLRDRLYLDFPASLHAGDAFYTPEEVISILAEMDAYVSLGPVRSLAPHRRLEQELLCSRPEPTPFPAVTGPAPRLSVIALEPDLLNQLELSARWRQYAPQMEVIVARVAGQKTKVVRRVPGLAMARFWLHLEDTHEAGREVPALLRNGAAEQARGEMLFFLDGLTPTEVEAALLQIFEKGTPSEILVRRGLGTVVETARFRELGGFSPLYTYFGVGDWEFAYRLLDGVNVMDAKNTGLVERARAAFATPWGAMGRKLHFHETLDRATWKAFERLPALANTAPATAQPVRRWRYRLEQMRDAYLTLYRATPRVAVQGNLQILMRPFGFLRQYLWYLKMPYHAVKPYVWRVKYVYYFFVQLYHAGVRAYNFFAGTIHRAFHFCKLHAWRVKHAVMRVYYLAKRAYYQGVRLYYAAVRAYNFLAHCARQTFHFCKLHAWRVKQVYHFLFWLAFPLRKVFYFCEYQYEKRVLGLHDKAVKA